MYYIIAYNKLKTQRCHTVGAVPKTLNVGNSIPLTHKNMTAYLPGLVHGDQG